MDLGEFEMLQRLGVALALGLMIGVERGWSTRTREEGKRVAGVRTFGLMGLLGGLWALVGMWAGEVVLAVAFAALAALLFVAHAQMLKRSADIGATTMVAALVTFGLGALAGYGEIEVAAAGAVIVALLLGVKPELHGLVARIEHRELLAVLELLLMSVVLLPVLPDRGYGPWEALNPYRIWWMVVLIAGISFAGYVAIRVAGLRFGIVLTGLFGGLASSTATAISLARLGKDKPAMHGLLGAGVVVAAATMFPRMLLVAAIIAPEFALRLAWPLGLAALAAYGIGFWQWRAWTGAHSPTDVAPRNPFELSLAIQFGLLLAVVIVLSYALQDWFGDAGLVALAAISGLADVDAVTLSYGARVGDGSLGIDLAAAATTVAAFSNTAVKVGLVFMICGGAMARRVALALGLSLMAAGAGVVIAAFVPFPGT